MTINLKITKGKLTPVGAASVARLAQSSYGCPPLALQIILLIFPTQLAQ